MSLWGRFLGNRRNRACAEGVTLLEQGKFAEAVTLLREASLDASDNPTGSLESFHFRQALVSQGRLHLRSGEAGGAAVCFSEAVKLWDQYPDLHCLLGAAHGLGGNWDAALNDSRTALRRNPDYACRGRQQRALGERMAINTVVQGSAADLIKVAMIALHRRLPAAHPAARLVLQIHDELVFEVPEPEVGHVRDFVVGEMEGAMELIVPLVVESAWSRNWIDAK